MKAWQDWATVLRHRTTIPHRTATARVAAVEQLRRLRMTSTQIAAQLRMVLSTVSAVLARLGLHRLSRLAPPEPPNRYERRHPGELLHIDVKKLGRIGRPGHRVNGDRRTRTRGIGWEYVHVCVDDATRLAYVEVLEDERGETAAGFLRRAVAHFAELGIRVRAVLTDNGSPYVSQIHAVACRELGLRHLRTRPYRPRTNGKAERFIQPRREQLQLLGELQGVLERSELEVHYQPKVALASGDLSGAEALVRWRRDGEYVSPARFIPIAEQAGMIPDLTRTVLSMVVRQLADWHRAGLDVHTSVNISVLDLADEEFIPLVAGLLELWNVPAELLELEITETALQREAGAAQVAAERLSAMGITLSVDDFGVGFAPLTYLTAFPLRAIKLDRSFVSDLATSERSRTVVAATIAMAHGLGLEVVAEGVETQDVAAILRGFGCDYAQGYGFAYPGPAAELARYATEPTPSAWRPPGGAPT